jgi:formate dehydrogenase maturation protein FdhE
MAKAGQAEASARGFSEADLEKGSAEVRKEMDKIFKQFSKEKPSLLYERINRVYSEENRAIDNLRREQILEDQIRYANKTPRVREEIVGERERLADIAKKA